MRTGKVLAIAVALVAIGASQSQRSVWDGVFTADQAKRGITANGSANRATNANFHRIMPMRVPGLGELRQYEVNLNLKR